MLAARVIRWSSYLMISVHFRNMEVEVRGLVVFLAVNYSFDSGWMSQFLEIIVFHMGISVEVWCP